MISNEYYLVCRNRKCKFSKKKSKEFGVEHFCPSCGTELLWKCPECDHPLQNREKTFCSICHIPLEIDVETPQAAANPAG